MGTFFHAVGTFFHGGGFFFYGIPFGGNAFNAFTEHPSFIGAPIQVYRTPIVGFHPTFSRHGIAQILSALGELIWLNEKVVFPTFPRFSTSPLLFYIFFFFLEKMIVLTRREYL